MKTFSRIISKKYLTFNFDPPNMLAEFDAVGCKIWPAAEYMVEYLVNSTDFKHKTILELGSGCGYVGVCCGVLGADEVILTDRLLPKSRPQYDMEGVTFQDDAINPDILLNLCKENIRLNAGSTGEAKMRVEELTWGLPSSPQLKAITAEAKSLDLILGADVTYHVDLSHSLFWTASEILKAASPTCRFIISHQHRFASSTAQTLSVAAGFGFDHKVLQEDVKDKLAIWEFSRR